MAEAPKPVITIKGLTKIFTLGKEKVAALNGVDLEIHEAEIVCLLGTSGSGKSTLLNMMAGLEKPTKGSIVIYGERLDKMSERKLAMFRQKNMGFVFQSYNLLPNLSAIDNVALPLAFAGVRKRIRVKKAKKMLKLVGLGKRMRHRPTQMSGGQQQRVGIARAFVGTPKIVFADEPTGNLDTKTTIEIMEMMVRMSRANKQTLIIVTHDNEIAEYADTIYHIIDGRISSVEDYRDKQIKVSLEAPAPEDEKKPDGKDKKAEQKSKEAPKENLREEPKAEPKEEPKAEQKEIPEIREGNTGDSAAEDMTIEPIEQAGESPPGEDAITDILKNSELKIHTEEE